MLLSLILDFGNIHCKLQLAVWEIHLYNRSMTKCNTPCHSDKCTEEHASKCASAILREWQARNKPNETGRRRRNNRWMQRNWKF